MNGILIAERCLAAGLNIHAAAKRAGLDPALILVRQDKPRDDRIPLGVLRRIGHLLDIGLDDLVDAPEKTTVERGDEIRVEAALATYPAGLTREDLARCFDWRLERVERSIAVLKHQLRHTGRRIKRFGWQRYVLGPTWPSSVRRNLATWHTLSPKDMARSTTQRR